MAKRGGRFLKIGFVLAGLALAFGGSFAEMRRGGDESLTAVSQSVAVDPAFAPVLQYFGSSTTIGFPTARASAVQADGKILVGGKFRIAGRAPRSGIARFNPDGTTDESFDAGDISTSETLAVYADGGTIRAIEIQPDGKILIGGSFRRGNPPVFRQLERLNPDGSPDAAFVPVIKNGTFNDVELLPDGKILVGGDFQITATNPSTGQNATFNNLARLNADGTFDFTFAGNGLRESNSIALLPDGKFVVGNAFLTQPGQGIQLIRYNQNGAVDAVLGNFNEIIGDVEIQPDGKIVVGGFFVTVNGTDKRRVVRFNSDGSLDNSFNTGGGFFRGGVYSLEIAADGGIVIGGSFDFINDVSRQHVARLLPNGALDPAFNSAFGSASYVIGQVFTVLALPNAKVFAGGAFSFNNTDFYHNIARFNPNGSIDSGFSQANVNFGGAGYAILQQPDAKILIGGNFDASDNIYGEAYTRYNADGTPDTAFIRSTNSGAARDLALQSDGRILYIDGPNTVLLYRLFPNGARDTAFPQIFVPFSASIQQRTIIKVVEVEPDDKILVGGYLITGSATSPNLHGLIRLNADGTRDMTFQPVNAFGGIRQVYDIARQPDGKIIIGGDFTQINGNPQFQKLARINPNGTIDVSFNPSAPGGTVNELELQPDGKIVYHADGRVVRVNPNGTTDPSFGASVENNGNPLNILEALKVLPDGKILIGGNFTSVNGATRLRIARLNADGSLDQSFDLPGGANDVVNDFSLQTDGKVLVTGAFTRLGGLPRIGAARLIVSSAAARTAFDFDGDGRADISVFRPSDTVWYFMRSANGFSAARFGLAKDKLAPADYDGDGKTDIGVYREGVWYILKSSNNQVLTIQFGLAGDKPQPVDFDGDGKAELAVYRPSDGIWYILNTAANQFQAIRFGLAEDSPVAADYTGDGRADVAVWRPSTGVWYVLDLTNNQFQAFHFGQNGDKPVPADYDGDGRADYAVYRSGVWYLRQTREGVLIYQFGIDTDIPAPADYDGDGRADISVFRPSSGVWYMQQSGSGISIRQFGLGGDLPVASAYIP